MTADPFFTWASLAALGVLTVLLGGVGVAVCTGAWIPTSGELDVPDPVDAGYAGPPVIPDAPPASRV